MLRLLVTANIVPSSPILFTLMMEAITSSEALVLITATLLRIPKDGILLSHPRGSLKSSEPEQFTPVFLPTQHDPITEEGRYYCS
jgi:hypothetical protein